MAGPENRYLNAPVIDITNLSDLLHCNVCRAEGTEDRRLRKCARCGVAVYCSKECQKADWPTHKHCCRNKDGAGAGDEALESSATADERFDAGGAFPLPEFTGEFDTPLAGVNSFNNWRIIHKWPLATMLQAMSFLGEIGSADELRRTPHVMRYIAQPQPREPGDRTVAPERAWILAKSKYEDVASVRAKEPAIAKMVRDRAGAVGDLKAEWRARYRLGPEEIAVLPVLFYVEGTGVTVVKHVPILAPRRAHLLRNPTTTAILQDLVSLCKGFMLMGVPLMEVSGSPQFALPGRVTWMRKLKKYGWTPVAREWDDRYLGVFKALPRKSDSDPVVMMNVFAAVQGLDLRLVS